MPDRTWDTYQTAAAFREALEGRLNQEAKAASILVDRLRKEAAFHRLLARLVAVDASHWALKGGFALIARLGRQVRGTRDIDTNWRATQDELDDLLQRVEELDMGDWFRYEFGDPRPMRGEISGEPALRYPVTCFVGDREFERLRLDVNCVGPDDPRPVEFTVVGRNPFGFVGETMLKVPMITPSHQLAEKLHAYVRKYADGASSRPKDLYDSLLIAAEVKLPRADHVIEAAMETFAIRKDSWPPPLEPPPVTWQSEWAALLEDSDEPPVSGLKLEDAFARWQAFWTPLMRGEVEPGARWSATKWRWQ